MSHTIKRAEAIKFLNERGIWRADPRCQHQYRPHDPAALRDNSVTVTVCRSINPTVYRVTRA